MGADSVNQQKITTLQAVVFDWAGTLMDHGSCAPARTFVEVFRGEGVAITVEQARQPMGMNKRDHLKAIVAMPEVRRRWRQAHANDGTETDIDRMYEAFLPIQLNQIRACADLIPQALEAVRTCRRRGLKIGSSTGYNRQMADLCVAEARQRGLEVDAVVCSDDVRAGRPEPLMIFENMKRFAVTQPAGVVNVDDTPAGVEAGRRAGCWSIGVALSGNETGLNAEELAALPPEEVARRGVAAGQRLFDAGADGVIGSVAQLSRMLEAIDGRMAQHHQPGDTNWRPTFL